MEISFPSLENRRKSQKGKIFANMPPGSKSCHSHKRTASQKKAIRKPQRKTQPPQRLLYDPARFLQEIDEEMGQKFERLYPKSLYDDTARHRIIVSGELARYDFCSFNNPMEGIFFLDEQGARMVHGRDIQAYKDKTAHNNTCFDKDGREHLVLGRDRAIADRSLQYSYVSRHCSEEKWNMPGDNEHHFLNFPGEIRTQILEHVLVASVPIIPKTVVCTWRTHVAEPGYLLRGRVKQLMKSTIKIPREDDNGTYTEIRHIYRKPIDATCLRVNKQFLSEGSAILYGHNTFDCSYIPYYVREKGRLRTLGDSGHPILRSATKPGNKDIGKSAFMQSVRNLMEDRETNDNLEGWIYCESPLRFLRTIGPNNAAKLRGLCLEGRSIKYNLEFYGPFIEMYCPRIRKLTIGPVWPEDYRLSQNEPESALFKALRLGLAKFPSLKELVIIDGDEKPITGVDDLMGDIGLQRELKADRSYRSPENMGRRRRKRIND